MVDILFNKIKELLSVYPDLIVIIYGPTATGKSGLSIRLADFFAKFNQGIEIISADSRQVYRSMDIGTDKIPFVDRTRVTHYGIDIVDPDEEYTAHQRQQDTKQRVSDIHSRGNIPVIVGGTGLYIDTIYKNFSLPQDITANRGRRAELDKLEEYTTGYLWEYLNRIDPITAAQFHPKNTRYIIRAIEMYEQTGIPKSLLVQEQPVDHPLLMVSLTRENSIAEKLIHQRVEEMIDRGLLQEVQSLLDRGYTPDLQSMNGIGYRQTVEWLRTISNYELEISNYELEISNKKEINKAQEIDKYQLLIANLIDSITLASVQYAKRQRTRFRRYEKDAQEHPKDRVTYITIPMD